MTINAQIDDHRRITIDQFTRQAIPFSQWAQMPETMQEVAAFAGLTCEDTVLDDAVGDECFGPRDFLSQEKPHV